MSSKNTSTKKNQISNPYANTSYAHSFKVLMRRSGRNMKLFKSSDILYTNWHIYRDAVLSVINGLIVKGETLTFEEYLQRLPVIVPTFTRKGALYLLSIAGAKNKNWHVTLLDSDYRVCNTPSSTNTIKTIDDRELFVRIYFDDNYDVLAAGDVDKGIYKFRRYPGRKSNCDGCNVVDVEYAIFQRIFFRKAILLYSKMRNNIPCDKNPGAYFCRIHYKKGDRGPVPKTPRDIMKDSIRQICSIEEGVKDVEFFVRMNIKRTKDVNLQAGSTTIHSERVEPIYIEKTLCRMFF